MNDKKSSSTYKEKDFQPWHQQKHKTSQLNKDNFQNAKNFFKKPNISGNFFVKTNNNEETKKKNSYVLDNDQTKKCSIKKPFDKKNWRLQKYSRKYKLQQWEEKRKKVILKDYYKKVNIPTTTNTMQMYIEDKNLNNSECTDILENENTNAIAIRNTSDSANHNLYSENKMKRRNPYLKAHQEYQRLKEDRVKKKEEYLRAKEEKDKAIREYKKQKIQKFKMLSQKTKKGQPIMKNRLEMLLEQVQRSLQE